MRRSRGAWVTGLLVLSLSAGQARTTEALRPALKELSQKVAGVVKEQRKAALAVGDFTGPAKFQASVGPGIQKIFMEELQQRGVRIDQQADLEVKGDYRPLRKPPEHTLELLLTVVIVDNRTGEKVTELKGVVPDPDAVILVMGGTRVDPPVALRRQGEAAMKSPEVIDEELEKLAKGDPQIKTQLAVTALGMETRPGEKLKLAEPQLQGTSVRAAAERPFGIEILVKGPSSYQPRQPKVTDGQAFVDLAKGDVFAVRLINDSAHEAAVELTLDGLNLFAFSDAVGARFVVIPPRQSRLVVGWHRDRMTMEEFVITAYAKSAAAEKLIASEHVGTITAAFHAAWTDKEGPPNDERSRSVGIGRGNKVPVPPGEVVERRLGRERDMVSVRYNKN